MKPSPMALGLAAIAASSLSAPCAAAPVAGAAQAPVQVLVYTVQRGDTLSRLAAETLVGAPAWREVARINRLANPHLIYPGQRLSVPLPLLRPQAAQALLRVAHGDVQVDGAPGAANTALSAGQRIQTPANGSAEIVLPDGSLVKVQPGSDVTLGEQQRYSIQAGQSSQGGVQQVVAEYFAGAMRLVKGSIEVLAAKVQRAKPLEVTTPTAVVGVRGTHFRVAEGSASRTEVLEGAVQAATPAAAAAVVAGEGALLPAQGKPEVVQLLAPPDVSAWPALLERSVVALRPAAPVGAVSLRWQIAQDEAFTRIVQDQTMAFDAPLRIAGLADGHYVLRIRAIDSKGIEGRDALHRFTLNAQPEPPAWLSPQPGGKATAGDVVFTWAPTQDAARYVLEASRDRHFSQGVQRIEISGSQAKLSLPETGEVFRRIASISTDGEQGPWSDIVSVKLQPTPTPPSGGFQDGQLVISWAGGDAADSSGARYEAQLARDAAFSQSVASATVTEPKWAQPAPEQAGTYFFRYRRIEADGFTSPWSSSMRIDKPHDWGFLLYFLPILAIGVL